MRRCPLAMVVTAGAVQTRPMIVTAPTVVLTTPFNRVCSASALDRPGASNLGDVVVAELRAMALGAWCPRWAGQGH